MKEKDEIMLARETGPTAVQVLAQIAREGDGPDAEEAIMSLVARHFLNTRQPTDDDLERVENMTVRDIGS